MLQDCGRVAAFTPVAFERAQSLGLALKKVFKIEDALGFPDMIKALDDADRRDKAEPARSN